MSRHAAVTINRPREDVERQWRALRPEGIEDVDATMRFEDAPGDRGTEIHAELGPAKGLDRLTRGVPLARVKDELRRFKAEVETGEVPRSQGERGQVAR